MPLSLCSCCRRHVREGTSCPFCARRSRLTVLAPIVALTVLSSGTAAAADAGEDAGDAAETAAEIPEPPEYARAQPLYGAPAPPHGSCAGCEVGAPNDEGSIAAASAILALAIRRRRR